MVVFPKSPNAQTASFDRPNLVQKGSVNLLGSTTAVTNVMSAGNPFVNTETYTSTTVQQAAMCNLLNPTRGLGVMTV